MSKDSDSELDDLEKQLISMTLIESQIVEPIKNTEKDTDNKDLNESDIKAQIYLSDIERLEHEAYKRVQKIHERTVENQIRLEFNLDPLNREIRRILNDLGYTQINLKDILDQRREHPKATAHDIVEHFILKYS